MTLLETVALTKHFKIGGNVSRRTLHAVDDVNLSIDRQEIVALVGESGSGKSTIARLLARVYQPTSGEIRYQDRPLSSMRTRRQTLAYRGDVPMVFQDPFSSLNPAYRVSHGIMRGLKLHRRDLNRAQRRHQVQQPDADRHVEHRHRLVGDDQLRPVRERLGEPDALSLPTRQLVRIPVEDARGKADRGDDAHRLLAALGAVEISAMQLQPAHDAM